MVLSSAVNRAATGAAREGGRAGRRAHPGLARGARHVARSELQYAAAAAAAAPAPTPARAPSLPFIEDLD